MGARAEVRGFQACGACTARFGDWPSNHPQVHVEAGGISDCVDADLAGLLALLWARGIRTIGSCQDIRGWAQLDFRGLEFFTFLDFVGSLTGRRTELYHRMSYPKARGSWRYIPVVCEHPSVGDQAVKDKQMKFGVLGFVVSFPRSDVPTLEALVSRAAPTHVD